MDRSQKVQAGMLAAGLSSDLAQVATEKGFTLSKLRRATAADLRPHFTDDEIRFIRERLQRKKIKADVVFRLLDESHGRCCICRKFDVEAPIVFHHIDDHAQSGDDTYDNLVVLCLNHHGLAHTRSGLARSSLPPEIIRARKQEWIDAVRSHRAGERPPPGSEPARPDISKPRAPTPLTVLVGRTGPHGDICRVIQRDCSRVAIWGMAGVGKTALALQVANDLFPSFPGGVLWSSLSDYGGDPSAVMRYWARVFGAQLPPNLDALESADTLRNWVSEYCEVHGRLLMVIDDARIEWIESVKVLTRAIPTAAVLLLTTREEAVAAVTNCRVIELEVLDTSSARELLGHHAGIDLQLFDQPVVDELLNLLGSLPLAVELLGKRIGQVRRKPGFNLRLLVDKLRKERLNRLNLPGHLGLVASFAISYRALPDPEKRSFRRLGLFASTVVSSADLAGVAGSVLEDEERALDYLVSSSLLGWAERVGTYRIHPLLREYAIALLLRKKSETERFRAAHLKYFASLALDAWTSAKVESWEANLSEIIHGVKVAGLQNPKIVLSLARLLWIESDFLSTRGYYREGTTLLEAAVTAAKQLKLPNEAAAHVGNLGIAYAILGQHERAETCYERALAIVDKLDDKFDRPAFLANLGHLYRQRGNTKRAQKFFEEALDDSLEVENYEVALDQFNNLGSLFRLQDPTRARRYYESGLTLARELGNSRVKEAMLSNIGLLHFDAGELIEAERCISEALELARRAGNRKAEANRLGHLGNIMLRRDGPLRAIPYFEAAVDISRQIGYQAQEADWLGNLGMSLWQSGDQTRGLEYVQQALQLSLTSGHTEAQGLNHLRLAELFAELKDDVSATKHRAEANRIFEGIARQNPLQSS